MADNVIKEKAKTLVGGNILSRALDGICPSPEQKIEILKTAMPYAADVAKAAIPPAAEVLKTTVSAAADTVKTTIPYAADIAKDAIHVCSDVSKDLIGLYKDCIDLTGQEGRIKEKELDVMYAKFKTCQQFFAYSFAERNGALQQDYRVLDDAIARGDRDMIIRAMGSIGNIVTSSPLSELQQMLERYDKPEDSLLDF